MEPLTKDINLRTGHVVNEQWYRVSSVVYGELYRANDEVLDSWARVFAVMRVRRRPSFYVMNVIVPCGAISLLVFMVFYAPSESGEKVTLGITVLLAFSVFQLLMAETLPKNSDKMPILGK